jgi:hypothetical protein
MQYKNNLRLLLLALLPAAAGAQPDGLYVAPGANFYNHGELSIWGNIRNAGNLGTASGSTVLFYGDDWKNNATTGTLPAISGDGGTIQFVQPRPAPYASNGTQVLNGGYTGGAEPAFTNLVVNNANNLVLTYDTRVKNDVGFINGKIILDANDLVIGSAGAILNYSQSNYVVTNNTAGHLVKESYTGPFIYPIGRSTTDYTPASITNTAANGFHVNVTDYAGSAAARSGTRGVDRTWNIYADNASGNSVVNLQHNNSSNQARFNPAAQFVTRYVGTAPNTAGDLPSVDAWERNTGGAGSSTGTLTTGAAITGASERSRVYTSFATTATANSANYTKASEQLLCLNLRTYLEGALINNGGATATDGRPLMRDNLRNSPFNGQNYIPAQNPYEFATSSFDITSRYVKLAPQTAANPQLRQISNASVLTVSGQNAIVDWVFVELRDKSNAANVLATRAALIQRDGDVVEVDGAGCLSFPGTTVDSYFVAVRHRSHLGSMTKYAQSQANLENLVDFSVPATPLYDRGVFNGVNYAGLAQKSGVSGTYRAMWAGDFNADGKVKYDAPNDDLSTMLFETVNYPANTNRTTSFDFAYGYTQGDFDMNSKVKFESPNDDNAQLLFQANQYPQNTTRTTNFDLLLQQLP